MKHKKLFIIILKFLLFPVGIILYSLNIINLFSSFLLFFGGYIFIKNIFDYRVVNKNIEYISNDINYKRNNIYNNSIYSYRRTYDRVKVKRLKK